MLEWLWAAVALAAFMVAGRWRRGRAGRVVLPDELGAGRLAYAERTFRTDRPLRLVARIDRAYRVGRGGLVLLELKTRRRPRVYPSDIIELSAQRVAVMAATGEAVADYAYVLTATPAGEVTGCQRVVLLEPAAVRAIARRRERLLRGGAEPRRAAVPGLCQRCTYLPKCGAPKD